VLKLLRVFFSLLSLLWVFIPNGSVVEYRGKGVEFSQGEGVDIDNTLASGFSQKAGGDLVEVVASITKGFEVHE
jgi:hypothetical protein